MRDTDLWRAALLGLRLPVSDLLDGDDVVQGGRGRHRRATSFRGSTSGRAGSAGARSACRRIRSSDVSTPRAQFIGRSSKQRLHLAWRLAAGAVARFVRGLRPEPLPLQVRADEEQRHPVLLHLAAHPAAGRPRPAVPGSLQGAGAARHAIRHDLHLHAHGAADRHLGHARPVQFDPDRARRGGARRRAFGLGRVPAASSCRSRFPAWSPRSSCRWC